MCRNYKCDMPHSCIHTWYTRSRQAHKRDQYKLKIDWCKTPKRPIHTLKRRIHSSHTCRHVRSRRAHKRNQCKHKRTQKQTQKRPTINSKETNTNKRLRPRVVSSKEGSCTPLCCSVLQCVAVCCSVLQCVAVCCRVLPCVAVCCSVLWCRQNRALVPHKNRALLLKKQGSFTAKTGLFHYKNRASVPYKDQTAWVTHRVYPPTFVPYTVRLSLSSHHGTVGNWGDGVLLNVWLLICVTRITHTRDECVQYMDCSSVICGYTRVALDMSRMYHTHMWRVCTIHVFLIGYLSPSSAPIIGHRARLK